MLDYVACFRKNDPEYQSDEKWWNLITRGDTPVANDDDLPDVAGGNPFAGNTGLGGSNTGATASDDTGDEDEVTERRESDSLLTQTYEIAALRGSPVKVQAFKVLEGKHPNGFYVKPRGPALEFHYWPDSKIFKETLLTPADMLINELAVQMHTAAQKEIGEIPISKVELGLREQYFPDFNPRNRL